MVVKKEYNGLVCQTGNDSIIMSALSLIFMHFYLFVCVTKNTAVVMHYNSIWDNVT